MAHNRMTSSYGGADYSAFAYSSNAQDWTLSPPSWTPTTGDFFPGAIFMDRFNMYIYFLGVSWYGGGVRIARVHFPDWKGPDTTAFKYWKNGAWVSAAEADNGASATQIIGNDQGVRAEFSVVWNAYAGRWMLMGLHSIASGSGFGLWVSSGPELTSTWTVVQSAPNNGWYAPMMSESYLVDGGHDIYYNVSSNIDSYYNPALWKTTVKRVQRSGCDASDN